MTAHEPGKPDKLARWLATSPPGYWVGGTGFALDVVAAVGYFMNMAEAPTIAFLVVGSGLVFASPLIDRLEGEQELSATGVKMKVLARREREVEAGKVVPLDRSYVGFRMGFSS